MTPQHLIIAPILIPFVAGALMLLYDDRQRGGKFWLSILSVAAQLVVAAALVVRAKIGGDLAATQEIGFYLLGDWRAPYGIVLVLDRLAAMMLVLTAVLAIPSLVYARAGWGRQGPHYYSLFQFLLVGLNGAFLTGDIFNLFVFFEILLAASYGLLLHGSGQFRVRAGMHYIAVNLTASLMFLVGVALIYGVSGTLNMGHLANLIEALPPEDRPLLHAGIAILAMAFLVKAGSWPLSFWLPTAYMAAAAPVGAMFAIMTKVGVYAILRLSMLLFGAPDSASAGFGAGVLVILGMATMLFGLLGILAAQGLGRMAAHAVLISSGTVLCVTGFAVAGGGPTMLAGALFYMIASVLATGTLFLMVEPMSREDGGIAAMLALTADAYGIDEPDLTELPDSGIGVPAAMTVLGIGFVLLVMMLAGLPPLPGFIGKVAMIRGMLDQTVLPPGFAWGFVSLLILSGFATMIGMLRIGIQTFWAGDIALPRVLALEVAPIVGLLAVLALVSVKADPVIRYAGATARALHDTAAYSYGVFATPRVIDGPAPADEARP